MFPYLLTNVKAMKTLSITKIYFVFVNVYIMLLQIIFGTKTMSKKTP